MIIQEDVSDEDAKALAEEYANDLKADYPEMQVNVQAVKDGENVASIELD